MKYGIILIVVCLLCACAQHKKPQDQLKLKLPGISKPIVPPPAQMIVPGKSVGLIKLGENADSVTTMLGKPDLKDGAMGGSLMTWYDKHDTSGYKTSIFSDHNFGSKDESGAHIRNILVTSPNFTTAEGLRNGMLLTDYSKQCALKADGSYVLNGKKITVYDDAAKGIAFDIDAASNMGVAIVIHKPGDTKAASINMH